MLSLIKGAAKFFTVLSSNCRIIFLILIINQLHIFDPSPHKYITGNGSIQSLPVYSILRHKVKQTNCTDADDNAYSTAVPSPLVNTGACIKRNSTQYSVCPDIILVCPTPICDDLSLAYHIKSSSMNQFGTYDCWYGGDSNVYAVVGILIYCFIAESILQLILLVNTAHFYQEEWENESLKQTAYCGISHSVWIMFFWIFRPTEFIKYIHVHANESPPVGSPALKIWYLDLVFIEALYAIGSLLAAAYVEKSRLVIISCILSIYQIIWTLLYVWVGTICYDVKESLLGRERLFVLDLKVNCCQRWQSRNLGNDVE